MRLIAGFGCVALIASLSLPAWAESYLVYPVNGTSTYTGVNYEYLKVPIKKHASPKKHNHGHYQHRPCHIVPHTTTSIAYVRPAAGGGGCENGGSYQPVYHQTTNFVNISAEPQFVNYGAGPAPCAYRTCQDERYISYDLRTADDDGADLNIDR